ncbi:MAG: hypothetical protein MUF72_03335 [Elainella sp. Prado103]|jgi:hypothetical protein|nr:hypothetical protein [Elainella sp. Prado103]
MPGFSALKVGEVAAELIIPTAFRLYFLADISINHKNEERQELPPPIRNIGVY